MRILVVDDEPAIRLALTDVLEADGHEVQAVEHAPAAMAALEVAPWDLILSDLRMPAMDGLELLAQVRSRHPAVVFALFTAHGDERTAVRALRAGAYDYVPKPFDNEEVRALVGRVREMLALRTENERLRAELADRHGPLIGGSPAMRAIYDVIRRAGPTDATVLITGESGTGKELVARAFHQASHRRKGPFIALNCSALPNDLVESELFGHARGAFTGADRDRHGLFEAASGGTILLDEIGDLAPPVQAKLLRVLEERAVTRLGESRPRVLDVRVLAATNRPLDLLVEQGAFRDDLLYRLRVVHLEIPPLRERREDIPAIAIHMVRELADRYGRPIETIGDDVRQALLTHEWPGNARELRNALERAVALAEGTELTAADLPDSVTGSQATLRPAEAALAGLPYDEALQRARLAFDRAFLAAALERNDGNITRTAAALGLHRQSLQRLLRSTGLRPGRD